MAKRPLVEVEGARQLRKTLRAAGDDLSDLKDANQQAANIAAGAARAAAPRRSGTLAGDIRASGSKTAGTIRAGRKKVPYAGPIHWGWPGHGIEAQPYLTEGAQRTEPVWVPMYERLMDEALKKVKGK